MIDKRFTSAAGKPLNVNPNPQTAIGQFTQDICKNFTALKIEKNSDALCGRALDQRY